MIKIFTYKDYLAYQKFLQEEASTKEKSKLRKKEKYSYEKDGINQLKEENETYYYNQGKQVNHEHDKVFRKILDNKKEASQFINKTLKLKYPINEEDIEKYNSSFITKELKNKEADIIYKRKEQNIFFLIEHQTKIY